METLKRYYCWRVGSVIAYAGERCPECSHVHAQYTDNNCGAFVSCSHGDHGHHCEERINHKGEHECPPCSEDRRRS